MFTIQPIDLSLSKNQNSPLDKSDKTIQLFDNPYITKEKKIEIIQKRRMNLQTKQKKIKLILLFKRIYLYILFFYTKPLFII